MSKTRKILAVCLAISVISVVIMVISAIIDPEAISIPVLTCTGIIPVVLCVALFSSDKNEEKSK